ncbi:MAG: ureidoglycolate lyase [Robiginitomaculum sp.]|nr:ureidoglycolate lyase [Robiginitomaculum sp.]
MNNTLRIERLTAKAFAGFGQVIAADGIDPILINYGNTKKYDALADLQFTDGKANLSIFRSTPLAWPIVLRKMECHDLGTQAFIPLNNRPFLVVVAPKGEFSPSRIRAFLAQANQGVNFAAGTWHHFSLALGEMSDFLVIDRQGKSVDCREVIIDPPLQLGELP